MSAQRPWNAKLQQWMRRLDERPRRERILLCLAAAAVAYMLIDLLLLGPALKDWRRQVTQQAGAQASIQLLQGDATRRQADDAAHQRQQQAELATWRQRVREGEDALRRHEATLVGPDQMLPLLDHMLARHGQVRLRAMHTLARTDLLAAPAGVSAGEAAPAVPFLSASAPSATPIASARTAANAALRNPAGMAANATDARPGGSLYRHGVELTLEGSYADLLGYVKALEAMPQRVLWGDVSLKVEQYPRAALTLQLFTISRDRHWLEI